MLGSYFQLLLGTRIEQLPTHVRSVPRDRPYGRSVGTDRTESLHSDQGVAVAVTHDISSGPVRGVRRNN